MNYFEQLTLVIISPTLVQSKDYAYVLEDIMTSNLRIVGIQLKQLNKEQIKAMFEKK